MRRAKVLGCLLAAVSTLVLTSWSNATANTPASAAQVLKGSDTAHLRLLHVGNNLLEEGPSNGILSGRMRAELHLSIIFTGSFTIYTNEGRISGSGRANPHGSGRFQSFSGVWTVTSGTGRYAHIHGRDNLYGVFDRRTYAVIMTTTGSLSY